MRYAYTLVLVVYLTLVAGKAFADPVVDGDAAFNRGDYQQALTLLHDPAKRGDAVAELDIGLLYFGGNAVPQDRHEAARWFLMAAHQGQKDALTNAGVVYITGTGVPRNLVQAYMWFTLASDAAVGGAAQYRDHAATEMTPDDIARATTLASQCKNSGYKDCGSAQCLDGPLTRTFGGSSWQVFACDDGHSLAFVAAPGTPPAPFDFTLSYSSDGTSSAITFGGSRDVASAARDEVASLTEPQRSALYSAALDAAPPPTGYGIVGDAAVAAYPPEELAARSTGEVILTCERDGVGKPHDCRITSETPSGHGFGAAAMKIMSGAAPEGDMQPGQRQALPFRFLFRPDPPTITPDVLHPSRQIPYIDHIPTAEESNRAASGMPLSASGGAKVECLIGVTGRLTACNLLSETPPGSGWGALELKMLPLDRFGQFTREGFPAAGMKLTIDTRPTTGAAPTLPPAH
jgi:TonB family protein